MINLDKHHCNTYHTLKILAVVAFALIIIPLHAAYAQEREIAIISQIMLRDASGSLVAFVDVGKIEYVDAGTLHTFLDDEFNPNTDPIFSTDEKNIQVIRRAIDYHPESDDLLTDLTLNVNIDGKPVTLVRPIHDGIPVRNGDTLTVIWTFIRTI
jgi:hypothetical protein